MRRTFAALVLVVLATSAGAHVGWRLQVRDGRLVDQHRREVTLRGVNARVAGIFDVTFADGRLPLDPAELAPSMERAAAEATAWGAPLLVGEYGIDPNAPNANAWISAEVDLQDRLRAHSAFWLWEETSQGRWGLSDGESSDPGGERIARTMALSRVYARAVPGRVVEHAFDAGANTLRLRYDASGTAPVELFVPARRFPAGFELRCDGAAIRGPQRNRRGVLRFRCGRGRGEHVVALGPAR